MNNPPEISPVGIIISFTLIAWSLTWKGIALWRSAKNDQKNWFIVFIATLIINTLGLLEIIYLFRFARKRLTIGEIKSWFQSTFFTRVSEPKIDQKKKRSSK